jgi:A/G-specific adenine glycosylase
MKSSYSITRYKVTLWVHEWPYAAPQSWPANHRLIRMDELGGVAMPSPYRRALDQLSKGQDFNLEA